MENDKDYMENELFGEFSARTYNTLRRHGIESFAKLAELFQNFGKIEMRNFGKVAQKECMDVLAKHGIKVKTEQCKRSLYMCEHARCSQEPKDEDKKLYCSAGHALDRGRYGFDGKLPFTLLAEGCSLELAICQNCKDYLECGGPLIPSERGFLPMKTGNFIKSALTFDNQSKPE